MSDVIPAPSTPDAHPDRYKTLVVILTVFTTLITAVVAGLLADANIRAAVANRDSQTYAILTSGELHRQGLQSAYDMTVISGYLTDSQEALVLQMTALQQSDDPQAAADSLLQADVAQARADAAMKFSIFFTDPRYAPDTPDGLPNAQAYLADISAAANDLVAKQNDASDAYHRWNSKGDGYTGILAVLAIAFLLFGLAQALSPRLRLLFAIFGVVALAAAGLWMMVVLLG